MARLNDATRTRWAAVAMREADTRAFTTVVEHLRGHGGRIVNEPVEAAIRTIFGELHAKWRQDMLNLLVMGSIQPGEKHRQAIADLVRQRFFDSDDGAKRSVLHLADLFGEHPGIWDTEDEDEFRRDIEHAIQEVIGDPPADSALGQKKGPSDG